MNTALTRRAISLIAGSAFILSGVGLASTASAHTGVLDASGVCQDNGTRLVTYIGTTNNVPNEGSGHVATLTVGEILPTDSAVSPPSQTVTGNTTFTFTQSIDGDATSAQATAFLVWGDGAKSDPIGHATFTTPCTPPVVIPPVEPPVVTPPVVTPPVVTPKPIVKVVTPRVVTPRVKTAQVPIVPVGGIAAGDGSTAK